MCDADAPAVTCAEPFKSTVARLKLHHEDCRKGNGTGSLPRSGRYPSLKAVRRLVSLDMCRTDPEAHGSRLHAKEISISLRRDYRMGELEDSTLRSGWTMVSFAQGHQSLAESVVAPLASAYIAWSSSASSVFV